MKARRILSIIMMLWGGVGILKWAVDGMPVYHGTAYAAGQNTGTFCLFLLFGAGVYIFGRSLQKKQEEKKTEDPKIGA